MALLIVIAFVCGAVCGALMLYVYEHDNAPRDDDGKQVDE